MESNIQAYYVETERLPEATKAMNEDCDHFKSRVVDVIVRSDRSICIVRLWGTYPYVQDKWPIIK